MISYPYDINKNSKDHLSFHSDLQFEQQLIVSIICTKNWSDNLYCSYPFIWFQFYAWLICGLASYSIPSFALFSSFLIII